MQTLRALILILSGFVATMASADHQVRISDQPRGDIVLSISPAGEVLATAQPNPNYRRNIILRPRITAVRVPLQPSVKLRNQSEFQNLGDLVATELFVVGDRTFVVVRDRFASPPAPRWLQEVRVRYGQRLGVVHFAVPVAAIGSAIYAGLSTGEFAFWGRINGAILLAGGAGAAWELIVRSVKDVAGHAYASQSGGDLLRVVEPIYDGGRIVDAYVGPARDVGTGRTQRLSEMLDRGCAPYFVADEPPPIDPSADVRVTSY